MKKIQMRINFIHEEFLNQADSQDETHHPKFDAELGFQKKLENSESTSFHP